MLTRSYEGFVSKHGQEYTLSGAPEEVRAWHDVIYPRCSNGGGQKKIFGVELRELYARKDEEVLMTINRVHVWCVCVFCFVPCGAATAAVRRDI